MSTKSSMLASLLAAACLFGGSLAVTSATAGAGNPAYGGSNVAVTSLSAKGSAGPSPVADLAAGSANLSATGNDAAYPSVSTSGEEALHDANLLTVLLAAIGVMGLVVVRRSGNR